MIVSFNRAIIGGEASADQWLFFDANGNPFSPNPTGGFLYLSPVQVRFFILGIPGLGAGMILRYLGGGIPILGQSDHRRVAPFEIPVILV